MQCAGAFLGFNSAQKTLFAGAPAYLSCSVHPPIFYHLITILRSPDLSPHDPLPNWHTWLQCIWLGSMWLLPWPRDLTPDLDPQPYMWPDMWHITWHHVTYHAPDQSGAWTSDLLRHVTLFTVSGLIGLVLYDSMQLTLTYMIWLILTPSLFTDSWLWHNSYWLPYYCWLSTIRLIVTPTL